MQQYLFLLTLGPVQSFIVQARKTQDLYSGSFLFSYLCRKGVEKLKKEVNAEIIFPNTENKHTPNRFIAILNEDDEDKMISIGNIVEKHIKQEFYELASEIIENSGIEKPIELEKQLKCLLTICWVIVPLINYKKSYKEAEKTLASVKNTRSFIQLNEENGRKCSVCGERNIKFYRKNKIESVEKKNERLKKEKLFTNDICILDVEQIDEIGFNQIQPGEGLCAVCFSKRIMDKYTFDFCFNNKFPSTARIALIDAYYRLMKKTDKKVFDDIDDQLIFDYKNEKEIHYSFSKKQKEKARQVYIDLKTNDIDFSSYYAVMLFDGDNMGKNISEPMLIEGANLLDYHKTLTEKLGEFADLVDRKINNRGRTVYAGGEDFLGFININYLFKTMKELRSDFSNINLSKFLLQKLTFSAGVVLAHYKTPLTETLNWVRKMQKEAKNKSGKDAFGLAVLKHSGEICKTVYKWQLSETVWVTDIINNIICSIKKNDISNSFLKKISSELLMLLNKNNDYENEKFNSFRDEIIKTEIKRLLIRSVNKELIQKDKEKIVKDKLNELFKLYLFSDDLNNFISMLNIIDFIIREVKGNDY